MLPFLSSFFFSLCLLLVLQSFHHFLSPAPPPPPRSSLPRGRAAAPQAFQLGGIGPLQTPGDGYVRRLYTTTVRLENPSAARERW